MQGLTCGDVQNYFRVKWVYERVAHLKPCFLIRFTSQASTCSIVEQSTLMWGTEEGAEWEGRFSRGNRRSVAEG